MFQRISPGNFSDYQLIDSGGFEKLERFGKFTLRRPEPQALWDKSMDEKEWANRADAFFIRRNDNDPENGNWTLKPHMPEKWQISYNSKGMKLKFRLGLTSFKHVGIFPEQGANWDYIYNNVSKMKSVEKRVLNLFAYTGGASLAACAASGGNYPSPTCTVSL